MKISIELRTGCFVALGALVAMMVPNANASDTETNEKTTALLKTFVDEFVPIRPGHDKFPKSFQMGSSEGSDEEKPQHEVTLKYEFAIGKYEVPQNLYEAVMESNPSRWKGPRNSVEMMSWTDANQFCTKVTTLLRREKLIGEDEVIRLPSEAEWEYCCRAGTSTRYSFGDQAQSDEQAGKFDVVMATFGPSKIAAIKVVREQTGLGLKDAKDLVESLPKPLKTGVPKEEADKIKSALSEIGSACFVREQMTLSQYAWHTGNAAGNDPPVGALKPNPWGLYDMHGYLWELTADDWSDSYQNAATDSSAVTASPRTGTIVLRSGSWKDSYDRLTSTTRRKFKVSDADDAVGFRCVKATPKP